MIHLSGEDNLELIQSSRLTLADFLKGLNIAIAKVSDHSSFRDLAVTKAFRSNMTAIAVHDHWNDTLAFVTSTIFYKFVNPLSDMKFYVVVITITYEKGENKPVITFQNIEESSR